MYEIKKRIYLDLDKTQKSALCNFLRTLVKQNLETSVSDLFDKFVEDEEYYQQVKASRFPFLADILYDDIFRSDTILYLKECKKYYDYKKSQAPLIAKQKEFEKQKRKFLQDVKMSKEPPTKKQLYYYDRLCKKYNIEKLDVEALSRLDLKTEIGKIIDEHSGDSCHIGE